MIISIYDYLIKVSIDDTYSLASPLAEDPPLVFKVNSIF